MLYVCVREILLLYNIYSKRAVVLNGIEISWKKIINKFMYFYER